MSREWWHQPLHYWSQALGFHYRIQHVSAAIDPLFTTVGGWWQQGDHWCITLDAHYIACLSGFAEDGQLLRDALSYTLHLAAGQAAGKATEKGSDLWAYWVCERCGQWGQQPTADLVPLLSNADELRAAWQGQGEGPKQGPIASLFTPARPQGHFVWLHWARREGEGVALAVPDGALRTVVEAYQPNTWLGPVVAPSGYQSALLWWPLVADLAELPQQLDELLGVLEADAMVFAQATFGKAVVQGAEWAQALLTTVLAWQQRVWLDTPPRVWGFGQRPGLQLLQALPKSVLESFLEGALEDSQTTGCGDWPEEWRTTLTGLLAANLNVSEAARLLYLHRNTLMNRIERIRERTGYDIRHFEDAAMLWLVSAITRQLGVDRERAKP
ncbi:PucR family transcriptional regulator [Alicyclobacillaceae bacterium I2511]|nr:PucR family transcriptional regulator [Alicyclobacillaceae bacterium I2511]